VIEIPPSSIPYSLLPIPYSLYQAASAASFLPFSTASSIVPTM
jgi:hypothetical protein